MTSFPTAQKESKELISVIRLDGFDVSWAGSSPLTGGGFVFGSDDGRILFTDTQGTGHGPAISAATSKEAINGLAFLDPWIAASTRQNIAFWKIGSDYQDDYPYGAHHVIAGLGGCFYAAGGNAGIISARTEPGAQLSVTVRESKSERIYFYRLANLPLGDGREAIVCAARQGGIATLEFHGTDLIQPVNTLAFQGLDVVDICALEASGHPAAFAALGKDGTIILSRDAMNDTNPGALRYENLQGVAYRILCARGHLFVLTSTGMYIMRGLVDRFLNGPLGGVVTPILALPMEAVDAASAGEDWVLIVLPDCVLRLDLDLLTGAAANGASSDYQEKQAVVLRPDWTRREDRMPVAG